MARERRAWESNPHAGLKTRRLFSKQLPSPVGWALQGGAREPGVEPGADVLETSMFPLHHSRWEHISSQPICSGLLPTLQRWYREAAEYPRQELNLHYPEPKSGASCQLGYSGVE